MKKPAFIHLRTHTAYSLLEGAIHIKDLIKWCKQHDMPAVAVTDLGNLFGSLEFSLAAMEGGIQPIQGCTLYIQSESETDARQPHLNKPDQLLAYAQNEQGWKNLLKLVSKSFLSPADPQHAPSISWEDLAAHAGGLIILTGGIYGAVGKLLLSERKQAAEEALLKLCNAFPNRVYVELMRHHLDEERYTEPGFIELAVKHNLPLIATNDCYFAKEEIYEAHDAFLCIAEGRYVSETTRRRLTPDHRLKTPAEMQALFADIPEALENTVALAKRCHYLVTSHPPILPNYANTGESEEALFRQWATEGLEQRLINHVYQEGMSEEAKAEIVQPYRERLEFELGIIARMKFPGYFLIVSDFITWSKKQGIPVGPGRGSGAGSVVAWAMQITDLDPLRYGLLFERFLNPERVSMPDFDVDFCQDRRGEVITYVQQKYGVDRVAQIITFGKLQARAVLRDVGRVLQMPYPQVDRICKLVPNNPASPVTLAEAIEIEPMFKAAIREDESVKKLIDISLKLEGLNRHASTHAAGVVIGDRPLDELVPMYRDPKSDMPVVQYSMKYAESAGLVKFDFLGLKTLTVLVKAVQLVAKRNIELDLLKLPEGDKITYALLGKGEAVGIFQLESAGMRDTLRKLKPDCLEDIIALVSLYRPGPMDNIPTYIARKHGHEQPEYLHPQLETVLKETFGVIIYQEQVMQIAQLLAGYSLGEADLLRRAMGKKIRSEMEAQRDIFVRRSVERGVEKAQAASIFDLIAKFAEYGFNKSHAAAYALIAYQTAYLKANYPVEFIAASMTYDMHNTDKLGIFREEAGKFGIQLLPPDINRSEDAFTVEDTHIRYALAAIRNVGEQMMQAVVAERVNGPFKDIFDFTRRVPMESLNKRAMEYLIKAGAFDALHPNRRQLFEGLERIVMFGAAIQQDRASSQVSLFGGTDGNDQPSPPLPDVPEWSSLEKLHFEFEAIGFYLSSHPLAAYKNLLEMLRITSSTRFADRLDSQYTAIKVAGIVTGKKFKVSDKGRFAFIQLSDLGGVFEVSVFNETLLTEQRDKLENGQLLVMQVDGKLDDSGPRLIAQTISTLDDAAARLGAKQVPAEMRFAVTSEQALPDLKKLLGNPANQGSALTLAIKTDQLEQTLIRLPGKYMLTPALIDQLNATAGLSPILEPV